MVFLGVPMLPHEAYIGAVSTLFDENGVLADSTKGFLSKFITQYEEWVNRFGGK
jgi:chromate reductase